MPKFYITDGLERLVVCSSTPLSACVKLLLDNKLQSAMVNGYYRISEIGFGDDPYVAIQDHTAVKISSNLVNEEFLKKKQNNT